MDGGYLTAIRTAAGSAVATRALASEEAQTLGIVGTGVQARFHVETIRRVRPIQQVLVSGTSRDKAQDFARWVTDTTGIGAAAASAEQASACDIVAACTTSPIPVVHEVKEGAHVNAVGAFTPTTRELSAELVSHARVYVDTRAGAFSEAGDLLLARGESDFTLEKVIGEVGEVLLGRAEGRARADDITMYKSVGAAFLDAVTARLAFEQAGHQAVGTVYEFDAE
jgi:ornithine cyclodeaminase